MNVMDKVNNILGKLPFVRLAGKIPSGIIGKIPVLKTVILFTNHAAVVLLIVVLAACFGGGGNSGGSGGGSGEASAQVANGGEPYVIPASDFVYELSSDGTGVRILEYTGSSGGNIILPTEIEGLPIVEIPDSIEKIRFANVTSVVFPDYYLRFFESDNRDFVKAKAMAGNTLDGTSAAGAFISVPVSYPIGINPFDPTNVRFNVEDNPLVNVSFPKGISYIPAGFFNRTRSIKSYTIPDTVKFISARAFSSSGLTSIVIPEGVTAIGTDAFTGCADLTSVTLPESIIWIGDRAFGYCPNLETVNLPSHKINFIYDAFEGCTKLSLATQQALRNVGYTGAFNAN